MSIDDRDEISQTETYLISHEQFDELQPAGGLLMYKNSNMSAAGASMHMIADSNLVSPAIAKLC